MRAYIESVAWPVELHAWDVGAEERRVIDTEELRGSDSHHLSGQCLVSNDCDTRCGGCTTQGCNCRDQSATYGFPAWSNRARHPARSPACDSEAWSRRSS